MSLWQTQKTGGIQAAILVLLFGSSLVLFAWLSSKMSPYFIKLLWSSGEMLPTLCWGLRLKLDRYIIGLRAKTASEKNTLWLVLGKAFAKLSHMTRIFCLSCALFVSAEDVKSVDYHNY